MSICTRLETIRDNLGDISDNQDLLLGLLHENIFIDQTSYGDCGSLISARVRIYSNPGSVGTNYNIVGTYSIRVNLAGTCKFDTWEQVEV